MLLSPILNLTRAFRRSNNIKWCSSQRF